jgi:hypothetical protein
LFLTIDYCPDEGKQKTMSVSSVEFIRRFMLHILPEKFIRILHYGFLSNKTKAKKIKLIKESIEGQTAPVTEVKTKAAAETKAATETKDSKIKTHIQCPNCKKGTLQKGSIIKSVKNYIHLFRVFRVSIEINYVLSI